MGAMRPIHAVLLAAGAGARMGAQKLLIEIGGRTVFEIALVNHVRSSLAGVCAVVPDGVDGFRDIVARQGSGLVTLVLMEGPCLMSDSMKAGWRSVLDNTDAVGVMVSLADQPLVASRTLDSLMAAWRTSDKPICVPTHKGRRGHPVIIDRGLDTEIMGLAGDRGARGILAERPELVFEVEIGSDEILLDLDRTEDLEIMKARLAGDG
jgi:molybdenum cofactor cytidylyltransferase